MVVGGGGRICLVGIYEVQHCKVWERLIQDDAALFVAANLGAMGADGASFTTTDGNVRATLTSSRDHPSAILLISTLDGLQFFLAPLTGERTIDEHDGIVSAIAETKPWWTEAICK
jgi:hypothetical protein